MVSVHVAVEPEDFDNLIATLWDAGTLGVTEGDGFVEAFFEDENAASEFGEPQPVREENWVARTQDAWQPILVGKRFFLVAPWNTDPTPEGRLRLEINPGLQCGTGRIRALSYV